MDKLHKLQKYRQKDYSMLVEFPVEIVGRNGVVRSYSFEDSVRLYQRRIASASSRYEDGEVILAEIAHCRKRIRQLRRSFYERYAWEAIRAMTKRELAGGEMAAEVAAFLARHSGSFDRAERYALQSVESTSLARVWYLTSPEGAPLLLYLYRLGAEDDCPARVELETFLTTLRNVTEGEVEHLHAEHTSADFGIVLTGREPPLEEDQDEPSEAPYTAGLELLDPVSQAVSMLRGGQAGEALRLLESLLALQPDHRGAAMTAALACGHLGVPDQAEMYTRLALAYHPDDPILLHQLGITQLQQDRLAEAESAFERAIELQPWLFPSRLLLTLIALHRRDVERARSLLSYRSPQMGPAQLDALRATRRIVRRFRARKLGLVLGGLASAVSTAWVVQGHPLAIPCLLATLAASGLLVWLTQRPKPLDVAREVARRMQLPREMLPPRSEGWEDVEG
jgi:Flp pilus assembly protein TadD